MGQTSELLAFSPQRGSTKRKHIDKEQPDTVKEHYDCIVQEKSVHPPEPSEISFDDLPPWFDDKLFAEGQKYYMQNLMGFGIANIVGLVAILSVPETIKVLTFTKNSSTACLAFRRYSQTLLHIYKLYSSDINDPESKWYKSMNVMRCKHSISSRRCERAGICGIYHRDMAITQFAFIGYVLMMPKEFGLSDRPIEREGIVHFWRVVGHMLGIPDRINICRKNAAETQELCKMMSDGILKDFLKEATPDFMNLVYSSLGGMWYVDLGFDADAIVSLTYDLHNLEFPRQLSWYSWMNKNYRAMLHYLCCVPYIGAVVRQTFNVVAYFNYWMLEKWPIYAKIAFGHEASKLHLYPKLL